MHHTTCSKEVRYTHGEHVRARRTSHLLRYNSKADTVSALHERTSREGGGNEGTT